MKRQKRSLSCAVYREQWHYNVSCLLTKWPDHIVAIYQYFTKQKEIFRNSRWSIYANEGNIDSLMAFSAHFEEKRRKKTKCSCYFCSFVIFHIFPHFSHICQVSTHFFMLPSGIVSTSRVFGVLPFRWQDRTDIIEGNAFTQWKWWKTPTYSIHWSCSW